MFEDLRKAWRQAVDNFWRELDADASTPAYREVASARNQLDRLTAEIAGVRQRAGEERRQAEVCERRLRMARSIGDAETARVAGEFGARHRERAAVLERKAEALEAEHRLCRRDLDEMERALQEGRVIPGSAVEELDRDPTEAEFRNLEDSRRDRAAEERLAELKRRMGK